MEPHFPVGQVEIVLKVGDITKESVDVIVNAANSSILGGGGVDGAIHNAAGPELLEECKKIRAIQRAQGQQEGCPTGHAVITKAGRLKAKHVIHTVGPDMRLGVRNGEELLRKAYLKSLELAAQAQAKTIAFPSISTGIYSYPIEDASRVAIKAVLDFFKNAASPVEVRFVLFSQRDFDVYKKAMEIYGQNKAP